MKRFAFATVSLIMAASSCSKVEVGTGFSPLETSYVIEVTSLPVSENGNPYFVDMADVDKYVDFRILESLSKGKVIELKSVEPIRSESGEISMYVIRYNEGWEVISSDKRTPLVLASAESGEFEYSETGSHRFYFDMVAEDLKNFALYEDKQLISTKSLSEEGNENVEYWDAITASEDFIQPYLVTPPDSLELIPLGHWELIGVESDREVYDEVDHLIPFNWGQNSPFNEYCPWSLQGSGHVPAGCVAVAGAQMLAYFQKLFDMEINVPMIEYSYDNVAQVSDNIANIWQDIHNQDTDAAAKLISYVGYSVNMNYSDNGSGASNLTLRDNVFTANGINSNYINHPNGAGYSDIIKHNLLNDMPVLVAAAQTQNGISDGHSFIIDGYKGYRNKYIYTYEWIYGPSTVPLPSKPPKVEIEYSSPVIQQIRMNWGYANEYLNDNLYTLTGDWTIVVNGENRAYNYRRELIYGFSNMQ